MFHAPSNIVGTPLDGVDGAVQYKMPSGSLWEKNTKERQLGHIDRHGKLAVFDPVEGKMKHADGSGPAVQPVISIFGSGSAAGKYNKITIFKSELKVLACFT